MGQTQYHPGDNRKEREIIAQQKRIDPNLLNSSQEAWRNYAKAESDLRASIVSGGSMYPMVWSHQMAELVPRHSDLDRLNPGSK